MGRKEFEVRKISRNERISDTAEGERIGKTWSNRHKENKPRDTIKCIINLVTNNPTRISKEMARIAANYHEKLQHDGHNPREQPEHQALEDVLRDVKMKLSEEGKMALSKPISEEEIREAIQIMTSEKAPGPDRIPIELWKSLDNQYLATKDGRMEDRCCNIIWVLERVFRDIEENGEPITRTSMRDTCVRYTKRKIPTTLQTTAQSHSSTQTTKYSRKHYQ